LGVGEIVDVGTGLDGGEAIGGVPFVEVETVGGLVAAAVVGEACRKGDVLLFRVFGGSSAGSAGGFEAEVAGGSLGPGFVAEGGAAFRFTLPAAP